MSDLPIIEPPSQPSRLKPSLAAICRCLLCVAVAAGLRAVTETGNATGESNETLTPVDMEVLSGFVPGAVDISDSLAGLQSVLNSDGVAVAVIATTQPAAKKVVGYRGTSDVALVLDSSSTVTDAFLLSSDDTPEHVAAIVRDRSFFKQFAGWRLGEPGTFSRIDSTTGATLTSLAIAESVAVRLGGEKPSLRFPNDFLQKDLELAFDSSDGMTMQPVSNVEVSVFDSDGNRVGGLIRTGPLVDSIAGYQGPSEVLIAIDAQGQITRVVLRSTYDNEPYSGYLNDEPYFWKLFRNKTVRELCDIDLVEEQVEGVSGATMTSMAVAETLVAAAYEYERRRLAAKEELKVRSVHWGLHDTGTVAVLLGAIVIGMSQLRGVRWIGVIWNLTLIGYLGLVTGNLISLAVLTGWSATGFAWRLAPGLVSVVFVSLVLPVATKRNLYCSHICPHGAAQQLLRNVTSRRWKVPAAWSSRLRWIPGVTLFLAFAVTAAGSRWNVAAWEPFNAYIWYVAGSGSIAVAVVSLLVSSTVPMAYCRYACGTGRLLDYVRRTARSDRFAFADGVALITAVSLWVCVVLK